MKHIAQTLAACLVLAFAAACGPLARDGTAVAITATG